MDSSILSAALIGYEVQLQKLQTAIAEIQSQLGHRPTRSAAPVAAGALKPKGQMSAKGKAAIRAAQKKRWEAFHAKTAKPAAKKVALKKDAPKRKLSPEQRAALIANLAKARAARAAKRLAG